jgi:uncharacterized damage-inducible protein DinB
MVWTSPGVDRRPVPHEGDERATLEAFIEFHRETFLWKCSGLTGDQLAARPIATTTMSLLGLIRHLSDVERNWLRCITAGESIAFQYWDNPGHDTDFDDAEPRFAQRDFDRYIAEVEICRREQRRDPESTVTSADGRRFTFRWILTHLIEEYSRHNGHADLIREAIDGATGE